MRDISEQILTVLRRVLRVVDRYSRQLAQHLGLSQVTVTDVTKRLKSRRRLPRHRDSKDRRRVSLMPTATGHELMTTP